MSTHPTPSTTLNRLAGGSFGAADRPATVDSGYERIGDDWYYRIRHSNLLRPFFISLVSSGDQWMFIDSRGALTAGRRNSDSALFPYYSSDKLQDLTESAGARTIIQLTTEQGLLNWEPFSQRGDRFTISQNCYRNESGSRLILEEVNETLQLVFRYRWSTCDRFGFVRECHLANLGDEPRQLRLLDGFQNLLPSGIPAEFQMRFSNLGIAYRRQELLHPGGVGVFSLGSIPSDRAEPNESLRATIAWQSGLTDPAILLSDAQIDAFRAGRPVVTETMRRGVRGDYLLVHALSLSGRDAIRWTLVADVERDASDVIAIQEWLANTEDVDAALKAEIDRADGELDELVASGDGFQLGARRILTHRHRANVTYNIMRGGIPIDQYRVCVAEFVRHLRRRNRCVAEAHCQSASELPARVGSDVLQAWAADRQDLDLVRIVSEYLPLTFSRRHGDPTRPWNQFCIETRNPDGSRRLAYEGNWRDLFQNWEALGISFPRFFPAMIQRFVNASTLDGYNPYRLTQDGFDWEKPEPDNPWAHIGYWGDHQVIYLLKLIEQARRVAPTCLDDALQQRMAVFADVPYRLKAYPAVFADARHTIHYDPAVEARVAEREAQQGTDGRLVHREGTPVRGTLLEKLLLCGLTKLANLVPGAGIWLNTQRPEWNDANNALVGHGASVVTVAYLRRYFAYLAEWFEQLDVSEVQLATELADFLAELESFEPLLEGAGIEDSAARYQVVDRLQQAASRYRERIYRDGWSGATTSRSLAELVTFLRRCAAVLDQTLMANRRPDGLYHAYNLLRLQAGQITLERLDVMLEGQVAALSSGSLTPAAAATLLDALRDSELYRPDQLSYLLYPNREVPGFLEKNRIPAAVLDACPLWSALDESQRRSLIRRDIKGEGHFAPHLHNSRALRAELDALRQQGPELAALIDARQDSLLDLYESTMGHARFTGRSGTFFAYEGLGSIYWHMVSKLLLAVQEQYLAAAASGDPAASRLRDHYREVRAGLGGHKSPEEYGAFPADPYSHTPEDGHARQPGMTGQVKEDILTRMSELGVRIEAGQVRFELDLFDPSEWLVTTDTFHWIDVNGGRQECKLGPREFGFTYCQVPIVYRQATSAGIVIEYSDGSRRESDLLQLSPEDSRDLFDRNGRIAKITLQFPVSGSTI